MNRAIVVLLLVLGTALSLGTFVCFGNTPKVRIAQYWSSVTPVEVHQVNQSLNGINIYQLLSKEEREERFNHAILSFDSENLQSTLYKLKNPGSKIIKGKTIDTREKYVLIFSQTKPDEEFVRF